MNYNEASISFRGLVMNALKTALFLTVTVFLFANIQGPAISQETASKDKANSYKATKESERASYAVWGLPTGAMRLRLAVAANPKTTREILASLSKPIRAN